MSLKWTKKQRQGLEAILESDHESLSDAADAVLAFAEQCFEERASFVVVGQLCGSRERLEVPPSDPEAIKLSLGFYSTEGDARSAAESLWHSPTSGDTFRTWVLNVEHGTAADWHNKRKQHYVALEEKQDEAKRQRVLDSIAKREQEAQDRAAGKGACECGHAPADHLTDGNSRGKCPVLHCDCPKFREKKWTKTQ